MERWKKRIRRSSKQVKIRSLDYEQRKEERKHLLHQKAISGERAALISEFADEVLADAQDYVLKRLTECMDNKELYKLQADYRAAIAFYQKVTNTVTEGKNAAVRLKQMEEE